MAWHERPGPDLGGTPSEEDVSRTEAAHRVELDPDEQVNYTEEPQSPGTPADADPDEPDRTPDERRAQTPDQPPDETPDETGAS
jgi:hypothetical protein